MPWCCLEFFNKRGFAALLALLFLCDFAVCFIVLLAGISENESTDVHNQYYNSSTVDTFACCLLRLVLFPLVAFGALRMFNKAASSSPLKRLQEQPEALRPVSSTPSMNGNELESMGGVGLGVPLRTESSSSNGSLLSDEAREKAPFEMKRDHALLMKKAEWDRDRIMGFLFLLAMAMALYNGLKCVQFHYNPSRIGVEGTLLASLIIFCNTEFFLLRDFVGKLTEEKGEMIPHLHMHQLFFDTGLKCHHCDVCHETMKGPHFIAYRCRICDFDLCPRCYKSKDKAAAKGFGAKSIRKEGEQITTWTFFKRIILLALPFWPLLAVAVSCLLVTQSFVIASPYFQGNIFDGVIRDLTGDTSGRNDFTKAVVIYAIINMLQGAFGGLKSLTQELTMRMISNEVRRKLFESIVRMDISFFDAMHTGQLTSRLTNDAGQMVQPLGTLINDMLANAILLVGGAFMSFHTSWKLSVLAITVVPPITFVYRNYARWGRKLNSSIWQALGEANKSANDAITNIRTVRGFSTEQFETEKYGDAIGTALQHGKKGAYAGASVSIFSSYTNLVTSVLVLWYGGILVCDSHGEAMTVGNLITFQLYWNMMNTAFISLSNVFNDLIRASSAAERVFSIMDARPDVDPDEGHPVDREQVIGSLELRGIQFRYKTRPENLVLKGVDLAMEPGTVTALVGKSGGGKSTLVHLLMRFYEPTEGAMFLDGVNMSQLSSRSLRTVCGFVSQDTQLFAASIEDNLTYGLGRPHTREELEYAAKQANAHEFIMESEEQYETRVGEKGMLLSGGQRQRLAIARCFLRQPRLLFLDEATSALDAENESIVQGAIDTLIETGNCTVTLIAHRLSTVINSTQIAVVHKGKIIEKGSHDDLISLGGVYSQLVKRQMARDASQVAEDKEAATKSAAKGKGKGKGGHKSVQNEIDELIEEMEANGGLGLTDPET